MKRRLVAVSAAMAFAASIFIRVGEPAAGAPLAQTAPPEIPDFAVSRMPAQLSLEHAIELAEGRSPKLAVAQAGVEAARGRAQQAGLRINPEFSVELENFGGSGSLSGLQSSELTVSLSQKLDLAGHRPARMTVAEAELAAAQLRFIIARADLTQKVRNLFAAGVAAQEALDLAQENVERAEELANVARELVDAGREPPLRRLRAEAALAQAIASLKSAEADEQTAYNLLAALLGSSIPPEELIGGSNIPLPEELDPSSNLDVALAVAEVVIARANFKQARADGRVDPSVGIGLRHMRDSGDVGLMVGISVPLPIFDRNQGNIAAAVSEVQAAEAKVSAARLDATARAASARASLTAADSRLSALEKSAIKEAREALRLAELSYRAGKSSLVELLDAQQAYALIRSDLISARLARSEAAATLAREATKP
jgi:cobalt-zinc-cadmium efflux system outer membrane protein